MIRRRRAPGLPDECFIRGDVPMTKQEVRAAALAKLAVTPTRHPVGCGRGHRQRERGAGAGRTPGRRYMPWSVTRRPVHSSSKTGKSSHACNSDPDRGPRPDALADLPAPDAVFIGGTKGSMDAVMDAVLHKNPDARHLHLGHCAGNAERRRGRPDRPRP
ncbi:MAG: hypothetical protein ACLVJH_07355 [Faecalibacterium prausnitzii]